MRTLIISLLLLIGTASAQVQRESVPSPESMLDVSTAIDLPPPVEAPRQATALRGVESSLPSVRTSESLAAEVKENQAGLTYLYKSWKAKKAEGLGGHRYSLSLAISAQGEVETVILRGPTNKAFIREAEAIIKTWTFSPVKQARPFVANLRNLDVLYRRELSLN